MELSRRRTALAGLIFLPAKFGTGVWHERTEAEAGRRVLIPARLPACPAHLQGEARKEWQRTGRKLAACGLVTGIDGERLAPPESAIAIEAWCDPEGRPCDPPSEVRSAVEAQARSLASCGLGAPENGCVLLLGYRDELQVVEL